MTKTAVPLPTVALRMEPTVRLLRAASYAQILQSGVRVEWVKDPGAIQNVYGALCGLFGTPGTAEVVVPDMGRATDAVRRMTARRIDVFFEKCRVGPQAAASYLKGMDEIRTYALGAVRDTFRDAAAINRDVARAWGVSIEYLADVHLVSTLLVKAGGAVLPGPATLVDIGYDIAVSTVPDLVHTGNAQAMAFVTEAAKEGGEELAGMAGEKVVDAINRRATDADLQQAYMRMREAERKLETTMARIADRRRQAAAGVNVHRAKQGIQTMEARLPRYAANVDSAQKGLVKAGAVRAAAKGVSFVFLAKDVLDAFEKHAQTVAAARQ